MARARLTDHVVEDSLLRTHRRMGNLPGPCRFNFFVSLR